MTIKVAFTTDEWKSTLRARAERAGMIVVMAALA